MSTIEVKKTCPECEAVHFVTVPKEGHARWKAGVLLQNAMPELSADDRETLLTGICPPCWDRLIPPEEDEPLQGELPGMWDESDFSGGWADCQPEAWGRPGDTGTTSGVLF